VLEAIGLTKNYGDHTALDRLDLAVAPGEIYCLLGANGAGKTTTINLFLDFIRPSDGEARIDGKRVDRHTVATRKLTAYIPDRVALYGNLSGLENLAYFCELSGRKVDRAALILFLEKAGLDPIHADKRVSGYSKGMRQKVAIAAAMARDARVMLLDEPTSGLDPRASAELSEALTGLREKGTAILMATHDIFRAREIGTRVGIMKHGRLVACIDPAEITAADLETITMEHMHD